MTLLTTWRGFWQDLAQNIRTFFHPDLSGTTNIHFGSEALVNLPVIVFGLFIGVMLAAFYVIYTSLAQGVLVRKLLEREIHTPEEAKTLAELGLEKNILVKLGLHNRYTLRRVVKSAGCGSEGAADGKAVALKNERFYIPEEDKYTASMRFRSGGNGLPTLLFVFFVSIACIVLIFALAPEIIRFLDNVLSEFTTAGKTYTGQ